MLRLTRWTIDHRRLVVILWIALLVGIYGTSTIVGSRASNNFSLPNTGSQRASDLLKQRYAEYLDDLIACEDASALRRRLRHDLRDAAQPGSGAPRCPQ